MKIYWSINNVPELAALPKAERAEAFIRARNLAWQKLSSTRRFVEIVGVGLVAAGIGVTAGFLFSSGAVGGGVGAGVSTAIANHRRFMRIRRELSGQ